MKIDWTNQDVARLKYLIDNKGKTVGIKEFSRETGRTENSIRIKLHRINKEKIVMDAENEAYKELNKEEVQNSKSNCFTRLMNTIRNILK